MPEDTNAPAPDAVEGQPTPGGETPEVDLSQYIPKSVFNAEMAKMRTKMKSLADPDSLLDDPDFQSRALEHWNAKPGKGKDPAPDQIEAIQRKLRKSEVEPIQQERDTLLTEVQALRTAQLTAQIVQAASGLVHPGLLKPPVPGAEPPIVNLLRPYFAYEPDSKTWAVREGEDSFKYSGKPAEGRLYMGPEEFLQEWASDPTNKDFIVDARQRGPGLAGTGNSRTPRRIEISSAEARDNQKYREAKARADELGVELVVI